MPRCARKKSEKQIYHVMLRGNNREKIFIDEEDKSRIIGTLEDKKKEEAYYLYAYCVMDNHIHLVIKEGKDNIARIIKRLASSYSYYFNKKYKRIGHVFQERYRSETIEDESYLLSCIRYIHQNPFKPGISSIEGYKWSSYKDYMGEDRKITDIDEVLGIISGARERALTEFARFNRENTKDIFLDIGEEKEIDESNVADYISRYLEQKGIGKAGIRSSENKALRDELIKLLLMKSNFSRRSIAVILGLNREIVRKAAMSKHLSP